MKDVSTGTLHHYIRLMAFLQDNPGKPALER